MIIFKLNGGLGNQMFQYAAGRSLSLHLMTSLKLDLSNYSSIFPYRKYGLGVFNIEVEEALEDEIKQYYKKLSLYEKLFNYVFGVKNINECSSVNTKIIFENKFLYDKNFKKSPRDCLFIGFWQSEKYFKEYEKVIRKDFSFRKILTEKNEKIAEEIGKTNSVSVHIRRGDYVNNKEINKYHGTCGLEYYENAINFIRKRIKNPKFFVFSDDMKWVKNNLKINNTIFVDGNIGKKSYIDMQLMSLCKHNIIANSSFSWWGAWLNNCPNKIVIAPKKWFSEQGIDTTDLIPKRWIKL